MKSKVILTTVLVLAAAVAAVMFVQWERRSEKTPAVEFSVSITRGDVLDFIEDKINISRLDFISGFIPEAVEISCRAELTGEGEVPIRISKLSVNGQEIPYELCEKYLDFSCSLVYN